MEFEDRNPKPQQSSSGLPMVVLAVLIGIICLLLYAGWHLMSDDASKVAELKDEQTLDVAAVEDTMAIANKIEEGEQVTSTIAQSATETNKEAKPTEKTDEAVEEPVVSGETTQHVVKEGETFYGLANKFNISGSELKKANPNLDLNSIKVGVTKITVPIQAVHTVGPGDVLRVVGKKYNVSVEQLMAANGKTKNFAARGEKLIIPKSK